MRIIVTAWNPLVGMARCEAENHGLSIVDSREAPSGTDTELLCTGDESVCKQALSDLSDPTGVFVARALGESEVWAVKKIREAFDTPETRWLADINTEGL